MIKGYIIKKIGEDVYFRLSREGDFEAGSKFPYIFPTKEEAQSLDINWDEFEVKRADIFITP